MKAIVLYTMRATATVLLGNSWTMVQSFCSKKLQRLILDNTFFCLIFVAVATYQIKSFVIFLDFYSTKQGLPLVDSWSRALTKMNRVIPIVIH